MTDIKEIVCESCGKKSKWIVEDMLLPQIEGGHLPVILNFRLGNDKLDICLNCALKFLRKAVEAGERDKQQMDANGEY